MRSKLLQPDLIIVKQSILVVIDKNGGGYVHGVDEAKPLLDAAFCHQVLDCVGDVHKTAPVGNLEPEGLGQKFHWPRISWAAAVWQRWACQTGGTALKNDEKLRWHTLC